MLRKKRNLLVALLSFAVMLTAAGSVMMQQNNLLREEFHQTYPLSAAGRVSLGNINGSVRVTAWDRNEVKVDAVKTAYRRDRLDEAKIVVRSDMNAIHIQTDYPQRTQTFTDGEGRYNNPATVEYTLTVPRNARISSIELINGDLDIDGITGDVTASSINGRVSGHELMGQVRLSTINGKCEAIFGRLNETKSISLGSINGPVAMMIPSNSNAEIKASTVHGGISNDFGLPVRRGDHVGRDLAGQIGQGGARIKLGNVNGNISVKRAPDNRPLSRVTNLLAEKIKDNSDKKDDNDFDVEESVSEARRAAREATREAERAQLEAQRAQREAQRAQREAQRAQLEAQRAEVEAKRAQAEGQRSAVDAQREAQRARIEAQRAQLEGQRAAREGQLEAQRAQLEAQRIQREAQLEAQRAQAEGARAAREAQRIGQEEASRARDEARRIAREVADATRVTVDGSNTLRLVERDTKVFKVTGAPQISLRTFDGYITVHGWDKQEVHLTINKRAASEQQMRGINLNIDQNNSNISVVTSFDPSFARREGNITFQSALVNLELYVPRSSTVRMASGDGRLELEGVNGSMDLNTGDGRIDVRNAKGRLTARTGDGRIEVGNFDGEVQARTGDGRIILDGRFAALNVQTGSGSILLSLPSNTNATIETDAESVDNQGLTLTEEKSSQRRLKRWKVGQGGRVLTLRTGEGRIFLRRTGQ
ncbi:MAG: DUF4097 family beta strand repeat protein [Acidobacteria bacterium]|nr:DUF4097 family beta strand repeat protein [Acidobacteriota bacterium]